MQAYLHLLDYFNPTNKNIPKKTIFGLINNLSYIFCSFFKDNPAKLLYKILANNKAFNTI